MERRMGERGGAILGWVWSWSVKGWGLFYRENMCRQIFFVKKNKKQEDIEKKMSIKWVCLDENFDFLKLNLTKLNLGLVLNRF